MLREPPFRYFSPSLKILALIAVMIVTFLIVLALGVALSIPFFGRGLLDDIAIMSDYTNPQSLFALKYFQIVNQIGVFIVPAILFVILTDNNISGYLKLDGGFRWFSIIFGFIILFISLPFINWLMLSNNDMHLPAFLAGVEKWMRESEESARKLTDAFLAAGNWGGLLVNLVMIGGLAAVGEELIFRGIMVRLFREWTRNVHLSVLIPALLFSALHLQFYGFFGRLVLGMILGYLFVWSGSLWVPIIVHFFNNAMAVILSFLEKRGIININLENFGTSQNRLVIIGSCLLTFFVMIIIYFHERDHFKKKIPVSKDPGS
jgi:membrane protease YdiL (CAAX protease family)